MEATHEAEAKGMQKQAKSLRASNEQLRQSGQGRAAPQLVLNNQNRFALLQACIQKGLPSLASSTPSQWVRQVKPKPFVQDRGLAL